MAPYRRGGGVMAQRTTQDARVPDAAAAREGMGGGREGGAEGL